MSKTVGFGRYTVLTDEQRKVFKDLLDLRLSNLERDMFMAAMQGQTERIIGLTSVLTALTLRLQIDTLMHEENGGTRREDIVDIALADQLDILMQWSANDIAEVRAALAREEDELRKPGPSGPAMEDLFGDGVDGHTPIGEEDTSDFWSQLFGGGEDVAEEYSELCDDCPSRFGCDTYLDHMRDVAE